MFLNLVTKYALKSFALYVNEMWIKYYILWHVEWTIQTYRKWPNIQPKKQQAIFVGQQCWTVIRYQRFWIKICFFYVHFVLIYNTNKRKNENVKKTDKKLSLAYTHITEINWNRHWKRDTCWANKFELLEAW